MFYSIDWGYLNFKENKKNDTLLLDLEFEFLIVTAKAKHK